MQILGFLGFKEKPEVLKNNLKNLKIQILDS